MLRGQIAKITGTIYVPTDTVDITNLFPRPADINRLIIIKLKRKLNYRSHV